MIAVAEYAGIQQTGLENFPDFQLWNLLIPLNNGKHPVGSTVSDKTLKQHFPNVSIPTDPKIGDIFYVDRAPSSVAPENHTAKMTFESHFIKALN